MSTLWIHFHMMFIVFEWGWNISTSVTLVNFFFWVYILLVSSYLLYYGVSWMKCGRTHYLTVFRIFSILKMTNITVFTINHTNNMTSTNIVTLYLWMYTFWFFILLVRTQHDKNYIYICHTDISVYTLNILTCYCMENICAIFQRKIYWYLTQKHICHKVSKYIGY